MKESLYRTKTPQALPWIEQCFELQMGKETLNDQTGYFVRETHCWLDPAAKRSVRIQYTLSPRGGFATIEEAQSRYDSQKTFRARRGFVHCFAPSYQSTKKHRYVRIEIPAEPEPEVEAQEPVNNVE